MSERTTERPRLTGAVTWLRKRAGSAAIDNFFRGAAWLGSLHPNARPQKHGIEVLRDLPYKDGGRKEYLLDVYRPKARKKKLPIVFYIHGGGFRILSKDTHWVMGLAFARQGYVVFNISYRLAPEHPFPAGLEDCVDALAWVKKNAESFGGDPSRIVFAGESAGANLATALTTMCCFRREEPLAKRAFDLGIVPTALLPYCGILQVSDVARFRRKKSKLSPFVGDRLFEVEHAYLGREPGRHGELLTLADPLVLLESDAEPVRPLPPCFATVGTADPLLDDTRRLARALDKRSVPNEARYYPGEVHAFHALVWRPNARQCWADTYRFLGEHVPGIAG